MEDLACSSYRQQKRLCTGDNQNAPSCKARKTENVEHLKLSPFGSFIKKAANINKIWETIMLHISGTDVANCLKVNRDLRSAIGQCLKTNTKFKRKMNVSATVSAINMGRYQSKSEVHFCSEKDPLCEVEVIDNLWYYHRGILESGKTSVAMFTVDPSSGETTETGFNVYSKGNLSLHPTLNDKKTFCCADERRFISVDSSSSEPPYPATSPDYFLEPIGYRQTRSYLLRYRLLVQYPRNNFETTYPETVFMNIVNANGEFEKCVKLHEYHPTSWYCVKHTPSNEEAKMAIILPKILAVHDATDGSLLWKESITGCAMSSMSLFITEHITGYLHGYRYVSVPKGKKPKLRIFDTKNGELISSFTMAHSETFNFKAKGHFLCYTAEDSSIYVIRVKNKEVERYEFPFPWDHFIKNGLIKSSVHSAKEYGMELYGFLAKSLILLGNISANGDYSANFAIDLDAAVSAKNKDEAKLAFSLYLSSEEANLTKGYYQYTPVYKADRENGSLDIVGIMRRKNPLHLKPREDPKKEKLSFIAYNFITEMQNPKDC